MVWVTEEHEKHAKEIMKKCEELNYTYDDVASLIAAMEKELKQSKEKRGEDKFKALP